MNKIMGIIKNVEFGVRDITQAVLSFDVYISEGIASLQILSGQEAIKLIEKHRIINIKDLEGKPCWIEHSDKTNNILGVSKFIDLCKID